MRVFVASRASYFTLTNGSPAQVAAFVFDAIANDRFYIYSHPKSLASVQTRLEDIMQSRNPTDPFAGRPEIGDGLKAALRAAD